MIGIRGAVGLLALSLCGLAAPSARASEASPAVQMPASATSGAGVGDTIQLAGMNEGERVAATVVRVVDPAQPASEFDEPDAGQRLVGVQLKLDNTGTTTYSDAPDNGAILVDKSGESFNSTLSSTSAGASFPDRSISARAAHGAGTWCSLCRSHLRSTFSSSRWIAALPGRPANGQLPARPGLRNRPRWPS